MRATAQFRSLEVVVGTAILASLVILWMLTVSWAGEFERFLLLALFGGVIMAGMRLALGRRERATIARDPFVGHSRDIVNISHITVSGVGGAGLVLAATVVALEYPLTTLVMSSGIVGGALLAAGMIAVRRRRLA
jgi:hypothetical protein